MTDVDDELAALRAERVTPSEAATQRIAERLSRSIAAAALGDVSLPRRAFPWVRPAQLAASFALGGLFGAGLYGALRPPRVERVYVDRPAASAPAAPAPAALASAPTTSDLPNAPVPEPSTLPASKPAALAAPGASVDRSASLAEQQALLDVARQEFAQSDYAQTLKTLALHSARFSKSVLAEEREALWIKALAASDRLPDARARAARFRALYPQSLLLPSIIDSVGAIP